MVAGGGTSMVAGGGNIHGGRGGNIHGGGEHPWWQGGEHPWWRGGGTSWQTTLKTGHSYVGEDSQEPEPPGAQTSRNILLSNLFMIKDQFMVT